MTELFMVFDVESIGLHGEGFAVGFVVVHRNGTELDADMYACPPNAAKGNNEGWTWVKDNVPTLLKTHDAAWLIRAAFWIKWQEWKTKGAVLVADCCWPVEARFLAQCVEDQPVQREWQGPYPLHDIASMMLAKGWDPLLERPRKESEEPKHHPLNDARQSARLMLEVLAH